MKFTVSTEITISVFTFVEAETEEKAKAIAATRSVTSLCHSCAHGSPGEEWVTSGELDGEPVMALAEVEVEVEV